MIFWPWLIITFWAGSTIGALALSFFIGANEGIRCCDDCGVELKRDAQRRVVYRDHYLKQVEAKEPRRTYYHRVSS